MQDIKERYEHLMRTANDAILLLDSQTNVVYEANLRAEEMYGYSRDELIGLPVNELRAPGESEKFGDLIKQIEDRSGLLYETRHKRKNGECFPVEASSSWVPAGEKRYLQAVIRDISLRKAHEEKISRLNRLYSVLIRINEATVRIKDQQQLYKHICQIAVEEGLFCLAWVGMLDPETRQVVPIAAHGLDDFLENADIRADESEKGFGPVASAIREGRSIIYNNCEADPRLSLWKDAVTRYGISSAAAFPLYCRDFTGALGFCSHLPDFFDAEEIRLLNLLTADLTFALESLWSEQQRREAEKRLQRFTVFAEQTRDIILFTDDTGRIIEANRAAEAAYGYSREELLALKVSNLTFKGQLHPDMHLYNKDNLFETVQCRKDGTFFYAETNWEQVSMENQTVWVFVIRDVTTRKLTEQQLKHIAAHDALTGLPNRRSLGDYLEQAIETANSGLGSSFLLLDIDNFKLINDAYGHAAGDKLLQQLAALIKQRLRSSDPFARVSGDEFAVILPEMQLETAKVFAEALRRFIEQTEFNVTDGETVSFSISIGLVHIDGSLDSQRVLSQAESALQSAKTKGRNRVVLVRREEKTIERLAEATEVLSALRCALKHGGFVLYYQPVVKIKDRTVVHHEALIRLKHPRKGLISPGTFIPIAETFGLMPKIDRWVIEQVIATLKECPWLTIFVNISGVSLSDGELRDFIKQTITQSGIEPARLGFEITETAAVGDLLSAGAWVSELKSLGCSFALDDFGIGFSSFSYVSNLPADYIKLDGSYVCDMDKNKKNRAIVEAIVRVARSLGKEVIAEFVENEQVLQLLSQMGVDCAQGYYTGKPSPDLPEQQPQTAQDKQPAFTL